MKMSYLGSVAVIATLIAAPIAVAQGLEIAPPPSQGSALDTVNPLIARGAAAVPIVRYLQAEGIRLTSLGDDGSTDGTVVSGYLGEAANGRFQTFYTAADGEHMVVGLMFRSGGANVTNAQIARMFSRFSEAASALPGIDVDSLQVVPEDQMFAGGPDTPILDWFRESGMRLSVLSEDGDGEGGFPGYFVEVPPTAEGAPGRTQSFYIMPDGIHAVAGLMVRRGGINVTGLQIARMQETFLEQTRARQEPRSVVSPGPLAPAVPRVSAEALAGLAPVRQADAAPAPSPVGAAAPAAAADALEQQLSGGTVASDLAQIPAEAPLEAPAAPAMPTPIVQSGPISPLPPEAAAAYRSARSTEDFTAAVRASVFFEVGVGGLPAVYMVADPQCPFCHEAWRQLRPLVYDRKIQLRVIMIAGLRGSDPIARAILARDTPASAWLEGHGSTTMPVPEGPAPGTAEWERAGRFLAINANFIDMLDVDRTPFLAYVAGDGSLYSNMGVPEDMDVFLAALK